ncbi:E3 ubiquitin-protein ligase RHA2A-like [Cynara cardunculus var. scolymus]|uniref:Zinc finger, RING-CH-type n=1 Tax=Cynara cardunculus var. scolymus TaxID=59895 RepID=A0A103XJ52_CYNCS|nr:E3 ubiquitin-protein ligase RHA2A-like [Cynara cardunculus var. scolymus]KVH91746.1 Zinc finger, RING-CH-type [Cynara cardunculus var. scolymus]
MGFFYLAIKIPQAITITIFANIASRLVSLLLSALSHLGLFKSPPDPDDYTSTAGNYVLILDGSSPSLLPVPVHVVTASIKNKVPITPYSDFAARFGGAENTVCSVCLDSVHADDPIRELRNCRHVFHKECLDRWVDEGQVTCPLCRSMLLPPKKLLSSATAAVETAATATATAIDTVT